MAIFGSGAETCPSWTRMVAVVYGSEHPLKSPKLLVVVLVGFLVSFDRKPRKTYCDLRKTDCTETSILAPWIER